jgi:heme A synthase
MKWIYVAAVFVLTVTGFGQMPIYKRYYIADLPGQGWLADFYITHYLHYIAAAVFFALIAYAIIFYLLQRSERRVTGEGIVKASFIGILALTGALLVVRNFPGYRFPQGVSIFLLLSHMGAAMALLAAGFYSIVRKKGWTVTIDSHRKGNQ